MNKNKSKLTDKTKTNTISEKLPYRHICLECCNINFTKGKEKYIFETLKDFSNNKKLKLRNPHSLNKDKKLEKYFKLLKKHNTNELYSVDIEGRDSKFRMLYCKSEIERVYKILALCTDETHR